LLVGTRLYMFAVPVSNVPVMYDLPLEGSTTCIAFKVFKDATLAVLQADSYN